MSTSEGSASPSSPGGFARAGQVIIVSSVMFTFISYWRTAAIVLCDLASTVFYIGAIVETAIGKAGPWFILAVLLFSNAIRVVYIESSALFVRGGVYRVVKEAGAAVFGRRLGGLTAKLSVSALLFDYVLTGPISSVSAGQYIVGLGLETLARYGGISIDEGTRQAIKSSGSVLIACLITLYFFRQNLLGIPESSGKALKIMIATTIMGVTMLAWCGVTLALRGPVNPVPSWQPDLHKKVELDARGKVVPKINPVTGEQEDPLGFVARVPAVAEPLRDPPNWLSLVGAIGIIIAFGHSILAMSGEETLAQVYREVESPKLPNFKKAAFVIFLYSLLLTGTMNFLVALLVPDDLRMGQYHDNWIGGLAMQMVGPLGIRLLLNAFVVVVGFLILSGAVNTSIIGSNSVLSRVAEDGVLPDWFLRPHRRYGTTSRILWLITGLQLVTIIASRGNVILLGEAYAFGLVWSFVFNTLSMIVLRFADRSPRPFKVPLNIRLGSVEVPVGLGLVFLVVLFAAVANLFTKQVATIGGLIFTGAFLSLFLVTEHYHEKRRRGAKREHLDQFNRQVTEDLRVENLGLSRPYRKLVAIRSPHNLYMLEKALAETDPDITDVLVMTAKVMPQRGETATPHLDLDTYDQQLMTAVVERAERAGKTVIPLIVTTNHPLHAVLKTAQALQVQELVIGPSNKFTADVQLDQAAFYWINLHQGRPPGLTVRILSRDRDVSFDLEGGSRIPKAGERRARSVAELRAAGLGVDRVLLAHNGTLAGRDLLKSVLTMIDPQVVLDLVAVPPTELQPTNGHDILQEDQELAKHLGRALQVHSPQGDLGPAIIGLVGEGRYGLIIAALPAERPAATQGAPAWPGSQWIDYLLHHAPCPVVLVAQPAIPQEVAE